MSDKTEETKKTEDNVLNESDEIDEIKTYTYPLTLVSAYFVCGNKHSHKNYTKWFEIVMK